MQEARASSVAETLSQIVQLAKSPSPVGEPPLSIAVFRALRSGVDFPVNTCITYPAPPVELRSFGDGEYVVYRVHRLSCVVVGVFEGDCA